MGILNIFKKPAPGSEPTVRVEFINAADQSTLGVSNMPASHLPNSFAIHTTLDIKDEKWSVISAEPLEKAEFLKTGKLRLVLARPTLDDPHEILFSLPTLSDDIGCAQGHTLPNEDVFSIHEDDWRQVEFVSTRLSFAIDQEFADIRQIWESHEQGSGFKTLHVRIRIPEPLADGRLFLDGLKEVVGQQKLFNAVGFSQTPGTISQSFAWRVCDNMVVWGMAGQDGKVSRLCLAGIPKAEHVVEASAAFAKLAERYELYFVDWCRMARISDSGEFQKYFARAEANK